MSYRIGIMQPYFLPYIGYWQMISACDAFVIYDDIQYTKKGWVNRNRILVNGRDDMFTLPVKNGSSKANIIDRMIADDFDREKFLRKISEAYRKAPYFKDVYPVIEEIILCPEQNLFRFIFQSIQRVMSFLDVRTPLLISSGLGLENGLKGQERVIATCKAAGGDSYLNPIGGLNLYDRQAFAAQGIELNFHKARSFVYPQLGADFVPFLSILDVMMLNSRSTINGFLKEWDQL